MRPGIQVTVRDVAPPRSQPTDIDAWFVAGISEKGPVGSAQVIRSMSEYGTYYGTRQSYALLYDYLDVFFREGGTKAYVSRVVGPAAVSAFLNLQDATSASSVKVTANGPGAWGNGMQVAVAAGTAGGTVNLTITDQATGAILEKSPDFADKTSLLGWKSSYTILTDADPTKGLPKVAAAASLATGADDRANITLTQKKAAVDAFGSALGPGSVSYPGDVTSALQQYLVEHAAANNRIALLDATDTATVSTLVSQANTVKALPGARWAAIFGPNAIVPGVIDGTTREIPYVCVQAGMMARQLNPDVPAAGVNGIANYATSVKRDFTDSDRDTLNSAGTNVARNMFGGVRTYGFRTAADSATLSNWISLSGSRTIMAIKAQANGIAENHVFASIDGKGVELSKFNGDLRGMLLQFYKMGALYGETPQEAFFVDTGAQVNTPNTIANGELKATIGVRVSPFAELVEIDIIKVPSNVALAA